MADSRFFENAGPIVLSRLAEISGAALADASKGELQIVDVRPLDSAGAEHLSFLDNRKYLDTFKASSAAACIVHPKHADAAPQGMALLVTETPYHAYARVASAFYPAPSATGAVHKAAVIDESARVSDDADIAAGAVIDAHAEIGAGCRIGANTYIGAGVVLGDGSSVGPNATVANAIVGKNVIIHTGVRIGQDGFGFAMGPGGHEKVPQLGRVVIGDNVEIGANTTIDRGTGPDTVIGDGCKIDNLVQIGHNVQMGRHCVIVSHVGISGSTELGDFVVLAGQAGIAGHLKIGTGARMAAQSGVMQDVAPGAELGGSPARPIRQWLREVATLDRLAKKKGT